MESPQPGSRGAEALKHVVPGSSIAVKYHPLFGPHDDLILLELDEKLLPDVLHERYSLTENQLPVTLSLPSAFPTCTCLALIRFLFYFRVVLRGQPDEDAVLCTQSKTYAMKFVGTSNSVLLIPPANHSEFCENPQNNDSSKEEEKVVAPVIKVVSGNIELVEAAPRLDKLKSFLLEKTYNFDEYDMENLEDNQESTIGLYSWNDLVDNIQASDEELRSGLQALSAVEINGYWRLVDGSYMDMILGMLLKNSVLNDWSLNALNEDEVVSTLVSDGFPGVLARHCLRTYGTKVNEGMPGCAWKLDEKRVCIHFAREILKGGKRKLESFLDEWRQKVPDGMQPTVDLVEGEVLIERVGVETWVRAFSVASLPSTPAERFAILFRERTKWEWKDLQPYVR